MTSTGDGDLGVTPGLVGDHPNTNTLLRDAGYVHRTTARPVPVGPHQTSTVSADLLTPTGLSVTTSRSKRSVPVLRAHHGRLAVGSVLGLEPAVFNRSPMTIIDFADPK